MSELEVTYDLSHLIQTPDFTEKPRLPRPRFQAVGEQGLEDLNPQPSTHSASPGLSSSRERVLQDSQRPDSQADIKHTCVAQTHLRVCAVFPVSGISD